MVCSRQIYGNHARCFHALVEESSDFLAVASVDGVLQYINSAGGAFLGIDRLASVDHLRIFDLIVPDERRRFVDVFWPALLADGRKTGDLTLRSFKTGGRMKASVNCMRIDGRSNREPAEVAILCRKTADQDRAELELKWLRRELQRAASFVAAGQVATTVAHELDQPLTAATNYLNAARRLAANVRESSQRLIRTNINAAAGQMARAAQIVRQLGPSAGRREDQKQVESLPLIIRNASSLAAPEARDLGIEIRYHFDDDATNALIDRTCIQQVFVNLLRNALEALLRRNGRELSVSTRRRDDDTIEVEVSGTGKELPGDFYSVLHEPFELATCESMMLRLLVCKGIIESYGGRLHAYTNWQGSSSVRFTVAAAHHGTKPDDR